MTSIISRDAFGNELAEKILNNQLVREFGDMSQAVRTIANNLAHDTAVQIESLQAQIAETGFKGDVTVAAMTVLEVAQQEHDRALHYFVG
jgi:hypothetical protein